MFILRVLDGEGLESNAAIGDSYNVIFKFTHPSEFDRVTEPIKAHSDSLEKAHAVIVFHNGKDIRLLYKKQQNYIMAVNGDTFCNLTLK